MCSGRARRRRAAGTATAEEDSQRGTRTSKYRGVTRHRRSGRFEVRRVRA